MESKFDQDPSSADFCHGVPKSSICIIQTNSQEKNTFFAEAKDIKSFDMKYNSFVLLCRRLHKQLQNIDSNWVTVVWEDVLRSFNVQVGFCTDVQTLVAEADG